MNCFGPDEKRRGGREEEEEDVMCNSCLKNKYETVIQRRRPIVPSAGRPEYGFRMHQHHVVTVILVTQGVTETKRVPSSNNAMAYILN